MKRIFLILFCINLFAQHTKLPMNISEVISLENPTYTVPAGYILQTLPLGTEEDPFDGTTQPGTVGVNDGVSGGWWSLEKIILTEGHKISSSLSAGALLYDLGSLKANVKAFKVLWYDESYTIPENTVAEIYSVYSTGINGNPDESTFRKANETEDKALIEGMVLSEGTSIKSWGVISIIEYDKNYSNNEIGVLSFVTEAGNVGVRLSSANAANHGDIGNTAVDLSYQSSASTTTGATGQSSFAVGLDSTASGAHSISGGYVSVASGYTSVALGNGAQATGNASLAIGTTTQSIGENSFAGGLSTQSTGYSSAALGRETVSSGNHSLSIGQGTNSHAFNSVALGQYNSVSNNADPDTYLTTNTALVIGNGADTNNRSNAFKVLFDGTTTVAGSVTASSFVGDGSQLTNLPLLFSYNSNQAGGIEVANYTTASGSNAFAVGNDNLASGTYSTAMGRGTTASGSKSTAMGQNTIASGDTSTAMGYLTTASGRRSTAMGEETIASGIYSTAMGTYTTAEDFLTVALGVHNKSGETPNPNEFSFQNTAFVIGNGGFANDGSYIGTPESYSNAFEVLFDGTTTIAGDLNVNSDARLKANIISLGATLSKLLQIDGKSYTMKKDESEKQKIGLLAQDIEKVFPELVSESNGIKSVNYQGLVPVLINALKEQDVLIKEQQSILSEQQSEIDKLKSMMQKIIERL